ncbi:hypothetical protein GCM10008955_06380 [Deinococcus malanensis]|uniref:DUF1795 domain-containing protein n=1 Tax=Deinococcus malanensis TaxID=1706855 RepID=A0ABQ2EPR6_9DEIO|nr:hypothetical protein [Deinococcus malanensis]GGK15688.1 hypothetical protein GCM10008955_06380 [Deinococcus malanensis]
MPVSRTLTALVSAALLCISGVAGALVVPLNGWTPVNGNAQEWIDPAGACVLREERHGQAFPVFRSVAEARTFAEKLQTTLIRQGSAQRLSEVVAQPVDRAGVWSVLAAYSFESAGVKYRVSQLYLSDKGILRTVTGSSAQHEASSCVNSMRDFIRYMAN